MKEAPLSQHLYRRKGRNGQSFSLEQLSSEQPAWIWFIWFSLEFLYLFWYLLWTFFEACFLILICSHFYLLRVLYQPTLRFLVLTLSHLCPELDFILCWILQTLIKTTCIIELSPHMSSWFISPPRNTQMYTIYYIRKVSTLIIKYLDLQIFRTGLILLKNF